MVTRATRSTGWAAYFSSIAAIIGLVSLILFFGFESTPNTAQTPHFWGPISDIALILQMGFMLVILRGFYQMQRPSPTKLNSIGSGIGMIGMMGVMLLQILLILKIIVFEQEVSLVLFFTGVVVIWLIFVNFLSRCQGSLPSQLAWLGIAVGAAFMLEPVMLSAAGGAVAWRVFMSNYFLLAASAVVFLVSYVGFPVWAFWLGRVLQRQPWQGPFWR